MRPSSVSVLTFFILTLLIAAVAGSAFIAHNISFVENTANPMNALILFAYILGGAVFLIILLFFYKGKKLFLFVELLLEFFTLQLFFAFSLPPIATFLLSSFFVVLRLFYPVLRQPLLIISSAIVGAILGSSLDWFPAVLLASLLSVYDYAAVFLTKHMVFLAKELSKRGAAFSISSSPFSRPAIIEERTAHHAVRQKSGVLELGTGDLVIPSMIAVSFLKISTGLSMFSILGSIAGLAILFEHLEKKHGFWPALPPVVGGAFILSLFYLLLSHFF